MPDYKTPHKPPPPGADVPKAPQPGLAEAIAVSARPRPLIENLVRIGTDRIVKIDGVSGIFTPIGTGDSQPLGPDERKNLLAVIDRLKAALVEAQDTNLKLDQELKTLRERPSAPDDFASAVQQSLDEVAQRLATMRNSMSNFAVRDFKLDASVYVQVSPLGTIEYRFVQPGETVDGAALSKLSMDVVPVPKNDLAGVWTPDLFQPEVAIAELPQVSTEQVSRLESVGLFSIGEFLQVGTRARAQAYLEALLATERKRIALWAQQAALMTLRGVNGAAAMVLIEAGIGSFDRLAQLPAEAIVEQYTAAQKKHPEYGAPPVTAELAAQWIRAARQYLGLALAAAKPA
jgi:uncharacterized protein DUF4332